MRAARSLDAIVDSAEALGSADRKGKADTSRWGETRTGASQGIEIEGADVNVAAGFE